MTVLQPMTRSIVEQLDDLAAINGDPAAGGIPRSELDTLRDRDGVSVAAAVRAVGLDPDRVDEVRMDPARVHAFVKLHIEQGSVLEEAGSRSLVTVRGESAHAGATPMGMRRDAFAGAAEGAMLVERLARDSSSRSTVATVGVVHVRPRAINVISGETGLQVEIRDHDLDARVASSTDSARDRRRSRRGAGWRSRSRRSATIVPRPATTAWSRRPEPPAKRWASRISTSLAAPTTTR
jgi:acetylornithine deacetylase/succinyl-diaminopimelate desuccinylase-like protein